MFDICYERASSWGPKILTLKEEEEGTKFFFLSGLHLKFRRKLGGTISMKNERQRLPPKSYCRRQSLFPQPGCRLEW